MEMAREALATGNGKSSNGNGSKPAAAKPEANESEPAA